MYMVCTYIYNCIAHTRAKTPVVNITLSQLRDKRIKYNIIFIYELTLDEL